MSVMRLGLKKAVIKSFGLVFAANLFSRATQFVSKIILAWFLLPREFGLFAIGFLFVSILEVFRSLGFEQSLIYTKKDIKKAASTVFFIQMAISLVLFAIVFLASGFLGTFFGKTAFEATEIKKIIQALSFLLIINSIGAVHAALLEKKMEFKKRVLPDVLSSVAYFAIIIIMAAQGFGVWSLVLATIASNILYNMAMLVLSPVKVLWEIDLVLGKELFNYGKFVLAATVLTIAVTSPDVLVISKFLSVEMLGFYSMAMTVSVLFPTQLAFAINKVTFPAYSTIRDEKAKIKDAFVKSIKYLSLFFMPFTFGIIVLAPNFVSSVLGKNWTNPNMSATIQVLALYGFTRVIGSTSTSVLMAIGKPKTLSTGALAQLALLAVILVPATMALGIIGTSIAITSTGIIATAYFVFVVSKSIGLRERILVQSTAKIFFSGFLMAGLIILLDCVFFTERNLFSLVLLAIVAVLCFSLLVLLFERKTLIELVRDIVPRKN